MADLPPLRVAVVGHVDHGKSTLIGRLFYEAGSIDAARLRAVRAAAGTDPSAGDGEEWAFLIDNLQEERERLMSIDTAQAFFSTGRRSVVVIDTPGHREFLRNMITGVTRSDAAVLVVAADEGVREQTRRHAFVLALVGVQEIVVVINKMDRVAYAEPRYAEVGRQAVDLLAAVGLTPRAVVPISARKGCNVASDSASMPWFPGPCLVAALEEIEAARGADWPARFPVQDVYPWSGQSCYAGRLLSGRLAEGDRLTVYPSGQPARVTEILRFPPCREPAEAGECLALTLEGAAPRRGQVLGSGSPPAVAPQVRGRVFWWRPEPLRLADRVTLRCATQEVEAVLARIERRIDTASTEVVAAGDEEVRATEVADLELVCRQPLVTEPFHGLPALGRFVLEVEGETVGAGIVVPEREVGSRQ